MHISNFNQCFYSKRGYGSYGSLWKVQNIWGEFFPPSFFTSTCLHHECNGDCQCFKLCSGLRFYILRGKCYDKDKDFREILPDRSQWCAKRASCVITVGGTSTCTQGFSVLQPTRANTWEHFFADEWGGFCHFSSYQSGTEVLLSTYCDCPQPRADNLTQWGEDLNLVIMYFFEKNPRLNWYDSK